MEEQPKFGERVPTIEPDLKPAVTTHVTHVHNEPKADGDRASNPWTAWSLIAFLVLVPMAVPVNVALWIWALNP